MDRRFEPNLLKTMAAPRYGGPEASQSGGLRWCFVDWKCRPPPLHFTEHFLIHEDREVLGDSHLDATGSSLLHDAVAVSTFRASVDNRLLSKRFFVVLLQHACSQRLKKVLYSC